MSLPTHKLNLPSCVPSGGECTYDGLVGCRTKREMDEWVGVWGWKEGPKTEEACRKNLRVSKCDFDSVRLNYPHLLNLFNPPSTSPISQPEIILLSNAWVERDRRLQPIYYIFHVWIRKNLGPSGICGLVRKYIYSPTTRLFALECGRIKTNTRRTANQAYILPLLDFDKRSTRNPDYCHGKYTYVYIYELIGLHNPMWYGLIMIPRSSFRSPPSLFCVVRPFRVIIIDRPGMLLFQELAMVPRFTSSKSLTRDIEFETKIWFLPGLRRRQSYDNRRYVNIVALCQIKWQYLSELISAQIMFLDCSLSQDPIFLSRSGRQVMKRIDLIVLLINRRRGASTRYSNWTT